MKGKTRQLLQVLVLLILGVALVLSLPRARVLVQGLRFAYQKKEISGKIIKEKNGYRIGSIRVATEKDEIRFTGRVFRNKGWVQHLVYLEGYKWLKDESAIIAAARLVDLQRIFANLNWRLWDELYYKRKSKMFIFVKWDGKEIPGHELVLAKDKLEIGDFVFLGSPYFDHIALETPAGVDCRSCPLFALEEKALRELFVRESGYSGYELNLESMPPKGTEVTIIIRLLR